MKNWLLLFLKYSTFQQFTFWWDTFEMSYLYLFSDIQCFALNMRWTKQTISLSDWLNHQSTMLWSHSTHCTPINVHWPQRSPLWQNGSNSETLFTIPTTQYTYYKGPHDTILPPFWRLAGITGANEISWN